MKSQKNGDDGAAQNKQSGKPQKKLSKKALKRAIIITLVGACCAAAVYFFAIRPGAPSEPTVSEADVSTVREGEFIRSISAKGTVQSASSTSVYCSLAYPVKNVFVKVGDVVNVGQPLAKLDDQSILDKIESQQASINTSQQSADIQIKSANDTYKAAKAALANGENTSIMGAQQQLVSAWENYEKAVTAYERQKNSLQTGNSQSILNTESSVVNAASSLDNAIINLNDAQSAKDTAEEELQASKNELAFLETQLTQAQANGASAQEQSAANTPIVSPGWQAAGSGVQPNTTPAAGGASGSTTEVEELNSQISALETTISAQEKTLSTAISQLEKARISFNSAQANYNITQRQGVTTIDGAFQTLDDYKTAVDSAYKSYQAAEDNLKAAQTNAQTQLQSYKNSLEGAQVQANNATATVSLKQMQAELNSTDITSPCSGTVTAVYAEVGKSGSGLLFVIQDLQNLVVVSSVKEYDMGTVKTGMPVKITSDATGGLVIPGEVTSISPVSKTAAAGSSDSTLTSATSTTSTSSSGAEFSSDITVTDKDTGLLVGMNVDLQYIVGSIDNAIIVPYDAVYKNQSGQDCVLTLQSESGGKYLVKETPVKVEMENDVNTAISGQGLNKGASVLSNGSENRQFAGQIITLGAGVGQAPDTASAFRIGAPGGGMRGARLGG